MTEQQKKLVEPILSTIKNDDIREFAEVLLDGLPDYMWEVAASSTSKYHPQYALNTGGLMRHQIAVVRFINFLFELEQYNTKFTDRELDLMRVAGLIHDGRKSGEQADYEKSKFTRFDHPIRMANVVRGYKNKYLNNDEIELIAMCIESHMGQFNTDKRSGVVLPKPMNVYQELIHLCDYLASRKDLTMAFDVSEQPQTKPVNVNLDEYVMGFGKYNGIKIVDAYKKDKSYFMWLKENSYKKEIVEIIKQLEAKQAIEEDDEI